MARFSILPACRGSLPLADTVNMKAAARSRQTAKLELVSVLLTCTCSSRTNSTAPRSRPWIRIRELMGNVGDPRFTAKAALFARNTYGMRSVSHLVAGETPSRFKGARWTKSFYDRVVRRPDDVLEILGYYLAAYGRPVPNSLKKGLGAHSLVSTSTQSPSTAATMRASSSWDAVNLVARSPPRLCEARKRRTRSRPDLGDQAHPGRRCRVHRRRGWRPSPRRGLSLCASANSATSPSSAMCATF